MKAAIILLVSLIALASGRVAPVKVRYDNYKVYRVIPKEESHVQLLLELENNGVSFWDGPSKVGHASDIALAPHQQTDLLQGLQAAGMDVEVYVQDIQALIDQEVVAPSKADGRLTWNAYHRLADIYAFLDEQAAAHPGIAQVHTYGQSSEGRDLKVLKLSKGGNGTKRMIFIEANIHAREWITNAVATYFINEFLNGNDDSITGILDEFDIEVVPVTNPDGYEYTHTDDRMWRKTRSTNPISLCKGADPNRNWGYQWYTGGSSNNPCLETYAGRSAFSEPETQLLADYFDTIGSRVDFYFDLHSYSQYFLIPYGFTATHIPEYNAYLQVGRQAETALAQRYGTRFETGNIVDMLYVASGGSIDWVLGIHKVKLVFAAELRDTGNSGFILPPGQIVPSSLELLDAFKVFVNYVRK